ncbi:hypothetical protein FB451DRAFT_1181048 [Mycena latifolia]|nr:hypothetical protein FB451DRAFT_1181048 [Mycena latifolia]
MNQDSSALNRVTSARAGTLCHVILTPWSKDARGQDVRLVSGCDPASREAVAKRGCLGRPACHLRNFEGSPPAVAHVLRIKYSCKEKKSAKRAYDEEMRCKVAHASGRTVTQSCAVQSAGVHGCGSTSGSVGKCFLDTEPELGICSVAFARLKRIGRHWHDSAQLVPGSGEKQVACGERPTKGDDIGPRTMRWLQVRKEGGTSVALRRTKRLQWLQARFKIQELEL